MHKARYNSRYNDPAPANKRTAVCGLYYDALKVHPYWKMVTCEECLKYETKRIIKTKSISDYRKIEKQCVSAFIENKGRLDLSTNSKDKPDIK